MSVLGYVMGDLDGDDVDGDDIDGDDIDGDDVVGRRRRRARRSAKHMMALPPKPGWRRGEVAPGIQAPREGLELMTLDPSNGTGTYTLATTASTITWTGRPQRPFRAERFIAIVNRQPDAGGVLPTAAVVSDGIFVGTQLQQLTRAGVFNVEMFSPTAFGVRMQLAPAAPGLDVTVNTRLLGAALTTTQTIIVSLTFMGHSLAA